MLIILILQSKQTKLQFLIFESICQYLATYSGNLFKDIFEKQYNANVTINIDFIVS